MKGENQLILNHASVIEAVQLWMAKHFASPAPQVTSISAESKYEGATLTVTFCEYDGKMPEIMNELFEAGQKP